MNSVDCVTTEWEESNELRGIPLRLEGPRPDRALQQQRLTALAGSRARGGLIYAACRLCGDRAKTSWERGMNRSCPCLQKHKGVCVCARTPQEWRGARCVA
eukprot:Tamp_27346.p2 GENE.Tamp_27346~~Tamp_27346.p2  ORF type:complete len:101 (-),score=1.16 Tamp_27346:216-518(-)